MSRIYFKENGEQGFPYILPVLRSYKQSIMFASRLENYELELPEINVSGGDNMFKSIQTKKRKKRLVKRNNGKGDRKNHLNMRYSPHFNVSSGRHSVAN